MKTTFYQAWRLIKPYWQSNSRRTGYFWLAMIVMFVILETYMSVRLNEWNGVFYNTLQNYNKSAFIDSLISGSVIMLIYVFSLIFAYFASSLLEISWRKWLTNYYLELWFSSKTYYKSQFVNLNSDNPDQRISEDTHQFVQLIISLLVNFFRSILTLGSFIIILWNFSGSYTFNIWGHSFYIPGYMVWIALIYAILGTIITFTIGNPLIKLNYQQQHFEADFRYNLIRVREYAEQICAYNGEIAEQKIATKDFDNIVENYLATVKRNLKINLFNYSYGQLSTVIPAVISAGRYFAKQINLGDLMQINSAFSRVQYSIAYLIYVYNDVAACKAVMNRISNFIEVVSLAEKQPLITQQQSKDNSLEVKKLNIYFPDGSLMLRNINFAVASGQCIRVIGASGRGKSTLMKTLNGMWSYADGMVYLANGVKIMYINQKPYLPHLNLKEAICYPLTSFLPSDDVVSYLLMQIGLAKLIPQLYAFEHWDKVLSIGEQQKISICRILINKPDLLFADEITSGLDHESTHAMFNLIIKNLPSCSMVIASHTDIGIKFDYEYNLNSNN